MRRLAWLLALLLSLAGAAWAAEFLSVGEDVPLMPGLIEEAGAAFMFDKPEGRIAGTQATGTVDAAAVAAFYGRALPPLGWRAAGELAYVREGERLTLAVERAGAGAARVRFFLAPED